MPQNSHWVNGTHSPCSQASLLPLPGTFLWPDPTPSQKWGQEKKDGDIEAQACGALTVSPVLLGSRPQHLVCSLSHGEEALRGA